MARKKTKIARDNGRTTLSPHPVYFLSLTVENVRCFGPRQTLDLSDGEGRPRQWTIILGDNGVGKTTLLQSFVAVMPVEKALFENFVDAVPRYLRDIMSGLSWKLFRQGDNIESFYISADFYAGVLLREAKQGKTIEDFYLRERVSGGSFSRYEREELPEFLYLGYGAARRMGEASLSDSAESDTAASLFSEDAPLVNAEEWLLQADYAASKPSVIQEQAARRRDQIKDVLINLLPDVEDIRFTPPTKIQMKPGIEVKTPYGWVTIKDLSLGYKTLIAWMVDFASRMFDRYPQSPNPLAEPAVVLVDEIDLHLHPKWQRTLMSYLTDLFPNTQFIATAHSPLVVQAATDANIVVLRREGDHVIIDNDVESIRGWRIDQVLTSDLFGLESARPPQLDQLLAERKKILSKGRISKKDREKLGELEEKIGPLPAGETREDMEAMDIIRRAAERLKQQ